MAGARSAMGHIREEFSSIVSVSGIPACDLHTWGGVLSAAVGAEAAECPNRIRGIWGGSGAAMRPPRMPAAWRAPPRAPFQPFVWSYLISLAWRTNPIPS